jgi:hypothetical protein
MVEHHEENGAARASAEIPGKAERRVGREDPASSWSLSRRSFVSSVAAAGAAGLALDSLAGEAAAAPGGDRGSGRRRRNQSFQVRVRAAQQNLALPIPHHESNGDEDRYDDFRGSYSKSLPHDSIGEVDAVAYGLYHGAIESGVPADFEAIPMGNPGGGGPVPPLTPVHKLINPQSGLAFDLEGTDSHQLDQLPAPAFASAWEAGEIVENYWMAHLRDVPYSEYATHPLAQTALSDLNAMSDFRGPREGGLVTAQTLFREGFVGCTAGPYLSQFFWLAQPFGAQDIDPRAHTAAAGVDYMTDFAEYLARQNGVNPTSGNVDGGLVYMRNGRDLGQWVHIDVLFQGYFQAFLTMAALGVPANPGNPYANSATQVGFGTFGGPHFAALVCEVATRALKAVWFQKWFVHRRLRPENFAARIHVHLTGQKPYDVHADALNSAAVAEAFSRNGTYLLPMAFPEGCPAHPAYGAGHATVAGACVTILKALFDENKTIASLTTPVEPTADGLALVPYSGADAGSLTVGGELNKLASNVAIGRNTAGVHWRTDGTESMLLGEAVAISILRDQKLVYNEDFAGFTFTKFDGTQVTV